MSLCKRKLFVRVVFLSVPDRDSNVCRNKVSCKLTHLSIYCANAEEVAAQHS